MNVLVEGIGSPVFGCQLNYYKELNYNLIGIDIGSMSFGFYKGIKPYIVPRYSEKNCFEKIEEIIREERIDLVYPTVNEGLLLWSERSQYFKEEYGTEVVISGRETIDICTDKWKTHKFFKDNSIPVPETSLERKFELLKPRSGRGSSGIMFEKDAGAGFNMEGYISQQMVKGQEYTIDVLCDFVSNPIYIIPRKRLAVESGVSVTGMTVQDEVIIGYVRKIIERLKPVGIINIQCFKDGNDVYFIEINPRMGGGTTLSFASSDNWFRVIEVLMEGKKYSPRDVVYNNYMFRYYNEVIVNNNQLV